MTLLFVTGTSTGVGKTVVTAAIAALALDRGSRVAVVKPAQTGVVDGAAGDLEEVRRLVDASGSLNLHELVRYPDPLSPAAAARSSGRSPLDPAALYDLVLKLDEDLVLVEGAGGLLVRFDEDGTTLADLARALHAPVLVVVEAGLGTLNHTALTLEALAHRGVALSGLVVGSWPTEPGLAERSNLRDLEMLAARPLLGALPAGAGSLGGEDLAQGRADTSSASACQATTFLALARAGLGPQLGGSFDPRAFADRWRP